MAAAPVTADTPSEEDSFPTPGEQRPFTNVLRLPETDSEETAAWEARMFQAGRYTNLSHVVSLAFALALPGLALAFYLLGFDKRIYHLSGDRPALAGWLSAFALALWVYVLTLPLTALKNYLPAAYGLLSCGFWEAFGESALAGFVVALAAGLTLAVLMVLMRRFHRLWWGIASAALIFALVSVGPLYPRRLPLSGVSGEPMDESKSSELVRNLTEPGAGDSLSLYVDKTGKFSDLIWAESGVFSREVTVSGGAVENLTPYELEVLVAHELAYFETGYRVNGFLLKALVILAVFFLTDLLAGRVAGVFRVGPPPDPRATAILAATFLVFTILAFPVVNGYSRYTERKADDYAIRLTRKPVTAAELYCKEAATNLSAPRPNAVLYLLLDSSQPPTDRIAQARALRQELAR
ncbi:MAG: M48 family metalloprotease [Candidatus Coatesbacteria bacterium]|nr:MAG: M48 family metalloprotease [Candidatus Coatesbacteria bacterium]